MRFTCQIFLVRHVTQGKMEKVPKNVLSFCSCQLNLQCSDYPGVFQTLADPVLNFQPSPDRKSEPYQTNTEHNWENLNEPADSKESLSGLVESTEKAIQATRSCLASLPDFKPPVKLLSPSRGGSEVGSVGDCAAFEPPSLLNAPTSPSERGKRVRKLKKRKVLKKAQGTEQPESSDTEIDGEALRPRWLRPRRRPSGSSQVSTSTPPLEEREGDVNMEGGEEASERLFADIKPETEDSKSPKHMVELPQVAPAEPTMNLDSEESMEVTAPCQQPHTDALVPASPPAQVPDSSRPEPQSLACNEVTSTSDMDVCRSSERSDSLPWKQFQLTVHLFAYSGAFNRITHNL